MPSLPEIIGEAISTGADVVTDALGLSIPGSALAGGIVKRYLERRHKLARDILFDELARGNIQARQVASEDEAVAVILRFLRASREGTARVNLRLLAKVIAGQFEHGRLVAAEFLSYADSLASLSRDELLLIGTLVKWSHVSNPWGPAQSELTSSGIPIEEIAAIGASAQRSGLIFNRGTVGEFGMFFPSPKLRRLSELIDFQDALRKEGAL